MYNMKLLRGQLEPFYSEKRNEPVVHMTRNQQRHAADDEAVKPKTKKRKLNEKKPYKRPSIVDTVKYIDRLNKGWDNAS